MKFKMIFLNILACLQLVVFPICTYAAPIGMQTFPITFNPDVNGIAGKLTAKIPLEKLGSVSIPGGRLKIKGNWAEVSMVQEFQFDHIVVLSGPVLNTTQRIERGKLTINGLAYFSGGDWLPYLSSATFQEIVSTDGNEFTGQIVAINSDALEMQLLSGQHQKIPLSSIRTIHSPRAFQFTVDGNLPAGVQAGQPYETYANKLSMFQTSRQFRVAALRTDLIKQGDGDLTKSQIVAIGATISGIQIGQMIPFIVVPLLYNSLHETAMRREYQAQTLPINISPSVSIPNYLVPPPKGTMLSPNLTGY